MEAALISAAAAVLVAAISVFLTKRKERQTEWRAKKLAYYEEFIGSVSGIVGTPPAAAKIRFANAVNNLHLIGSQAVIDALHNFLDFTAESNPVRNVEAQEKMFSILVWQIRADLGDKPRRPVDEFDVRLWNSGTGSNVLN
jgi:hypothetical protein